MKKFQRVASKKDFNAVMESNRCANKYFSIFYCENAFDYARIGVTIGKKNAPKAVERNYIKRQLRAILSERYKYLKKYDIIVVVSKTGKNLSYQEKCIFLDKLLISKGLMEEIDV